jgi:hypothetical protein
MDPHQAVPNMTCSAKKGLLDCQEISCPASAVYTDPVNFHFFLSEFRKMGRTSKTLLKYIASPGAYIFCHANLHEVNMVYHTLHM